MPARHSHSRTMFRRLVAVASTGSLVVAGLVVTALAVPTIAAADPSPIAARTATQVTADALPTVQIDGIVWSQTVLGSGNSGVVYAGGSFANARPAGSAVGTNQTPRGNLLAYNISTGALITSFAQGTGLNGQVMAVAASPDGKTIYVGGDFTTADGTIHNRLAAYSVATGTVIKTFVANVAGQVRSIVATNTAVYAGGNFGSAGNTNRGNLAAFDPTTGALLGWAPTADSAVNAMVMSPDGTKLFIGGRFANINGSAAYGLASVSAADGSLIPFAVNNTIKDAGANSAIESLTTDGTSIYGTGYVFGTGGNLEGAFSANPTTGVINWIEDCHGDTYSAYPMNGALYTVSHAHYCGNIGAFFQSNPLIVNQRRALAFTTTATGTIGKEYLGYFNWAGNNSPSQLNWYPDLTTANVSGANQAAWSVSGNGSYVVLGGEFPTVNGTAQQGLVRFATPSTLTSIGSSPKQGGMLTGAHAAPTLLSTTPGTVRISWPSNWDRDDKTLTYKVVRDGITATPIYTVTADSTFWNKPDLGFTDTGLVPGSQHRYRIFENDADGNTVAGDTVYVTVAAASTLSPYANDVISAGANHYWRLGEATGTNVYDYAGYDDGTALGTVTRGIAGPVNGDANTGTSFNGSTGFVVDSALIPAPNTFTVGAWFKTTSTAGGKIVGFGNENAGNSTQYDRHIYMSTNGLLHFGVSNTSQFIIDSSAAYNDGQWHQVVGTLGPNGMAMYVDGHLIGTNQGTTVGAAYSGFWRIGGDTSWSGAAYFNGSIAEVATYPTVLNGADVRKQYVDSGRTYATATAPTDAFGAAVYKDSPSLYYRFDETSGTVVTDSSGNQANGVYHGVYTLGTPSTVSGSTGSAVTFAGVAGSTVSSATFVAAPATYSQEVWFKTNTTRGGKLIGFGNGNSGNSTNYDRQIYMTNTGQVIYQVRPTTTTTASVTSAAGFNDNRWHQVVSTMGPDGMKMYIDGALVGTNGNKNQLAFSGWWRIGGDAGAGGTSTYFAGAIDETSIYNYPLTAAQVTAHFTGTAGPNAAPTAAFTSTATNLAVTFNGATSTDTDGTIASYAWDFGDTTTGTGVSPAHTYTAAGTYPVKLTVTDNGGATGTVTQQVTVVAANVAPTAAFTSTVTNLGVAFNGSTSSDPDGSIAAYAWDFGDSTTGTGVSPSHTYTAAGTYNATLTVTDNGGATSTVVHQVTVVAANVAPTAAFTSTATNLAVAFNGSTSTDTDGTIASYAWDFGDSTSDTGVSPSHTYTAAGTYSVKLTVTDNGGATGTVTQSVTVAAAPPANVAPVASFTSTVNGLSVAFDGTASADSDGTIASYAWDFGDSTSGTGASASHTYTTAGDFTVTLTVTDNGGLTGTVSHVVTTTATPPANVAPVAAFTSAATNLAVAFNGSTSTDSDGTIAGYAWTFGDGGTATGATPSHTYTASGTYTVTLTVTDNGGLTNAVSHTVTVTAPSPVVAADLFNRTAVNSWGSADTGGAWTLNGSTALFAVNGSAATMKMATAGAGPAAYLNSVSAANVNGTVDVTLSSAPTGGGTYISLAGRHTGTSDYRARVRFQPTSTTIAIDKLLNGTETALKQVTISGLTYNAGDTIRIRLQITGNGTSTISARAWKTSAAEPTAWQVSTTDTEATLQGSGGVGFTSYLSSSSTAPVTATYDNLSFTTNVTP